MRAEGFLRNWTYDILSWMHKKRCEALFCVALSAVEGGKLSVTGLGRSMEGRAREKHKIKKADRLLSNDILGDEILEVYRSLAAAVIGAIRRPIIQVDWSNIDMGQNFFLLRATCAVHGRSLTIYEEVHGVSTKEKRSTHACFLRNLKKVLPEDSLPIIVTDAGFRGPWFRAVSKLGWDWVGRVRNRDYVRLSNCSCWQGAKTLYKQATRTPKLLGHLHLTRSQPLLCQMVLYKAKPKGRLRKTKLNTIARARKSQRCSAAAREPWLLATSLRNCSAQKVVRIYAARMQIEESFRDLKSPRYGMGLEFSGSRSVSRFRVLVLLGSLAALFATLLGYAARAANIHRHFQANTVSNTHVLSAFFLGVQVFRARRFRLTREKLLNALADLNQAALCFALD